MTTLAVVFFDWNYNPVLILSQLLWRVLGIGQFAELLLIEVLASATSAYFFVLVCRLGVG